MSDFDSSLKAAELATKAFALLTELQVDYPKIQQDLERGQIYMMGVWGCIFKKYPNINGENLVRIPLALQVANPIVITPVEPEIEEEIEYWERGYDPDALRCKALLVEIIKRAAYDWILYRTSSRIEQKELAADAYTWLFEEDEEHHNFRTRENEGEKELTSFVAICDVLNFDINILRAKVRKMDRRSIQCAGRPVESFSSDNSGVEAHGMSAAIDMDVAPSRDFATSYESYGSVATPSRLRWSDY